MHIYTCTRTYTYIRIHVHILLIISIPDPILLSYHNKHTNNHQLLIFFSHDLLDVISNACQRQHQSTTHTEQNM